MSEDERAVLDACQPHPRGGLLIIAERAETPPPEGFDRVLAQCLAVDEHPPFEEHTLLTLAGRHRHGQVLLEALASEGGGTGGTGQVPTGYAVLTDVHARAWQVEIAVAPPRRGQGIGTALLLAVRDHVAATGGGVLRGWAHQRVLIADRLAAHAGMRIERRLLFMVRSLPAPPPPDPPSGVLVRGFVRGQDEAGWLEVNNAAFSGHPEQGAWTLDDLLWRLEADWSDAARFVLAADDTGLLAGVWTKLPPGGSQGELYVVAVAPRAQGRGLGPLVVAHALAALAAVGATSACLYCDAANRPARRMYERAGFAVAREDRSYVVKI